MHKSMDNCSSITNCPGIQYHHNIEQCSFCIKENNLVKQLKQTCDERGREIDPNAAGTLFHQLGQVYHERIQASDKCDWRETAFDLIRTIALYNAAIIRSPNNAKEIRNDLQNLCRLVLKMASATDLKC